MMPQSSDQDPLQSQPQPTPPLELSSLIVGGAAFTNFYNSNDELQRNTPESTLLFAFRNGINAVDTSPYYGTSQSVIGEIITKPEFQAEFPRSSYYLLTKCGRYGPSRKDFDYSPSRIIRSVEESCSLMGTSYLDAVYLHDVEFVAEDPHQDDHVGEPANQPDHPFITKNNGQSYGPGDEIVILAIRTLFQLKGQGLIKKVGISGYPLGTLLRISQLIEKQLGLPLDLVMSYACFTLQNDTLSNYIPNFKAAGVGQVISASPLGMGLLTSRGPPEWHPAPQSLRKAIADVSETVRSSFKLSLERLALHRALVFPQTVLGFSSIDEVRFALDVLDEIRNGIQPDSQICLAQALVKKELINSGFYNWSWPTPSA